MNGITRLKRYLCAALAAVTLFTFFFSSFAALKTILLGDADQNGDIDAYDARMALRFAVEIDTPSSMDVTVCDIDGNGSVDSGDARAILRVAVGLDDLHGKVAGVKLETETTVPPTTQPTTAPPTTEPPTTSPPVTQPPVLSIDLQCVKGNRFLTTAEMGVNARLIYQFLSARGWTKNAICGVLGNMEVESTINPGIHEIGGGSGFGLVQWTPGSLYNNWAATHGYASDSLEGQLTFMIYTMEPSCPSLDKIWYKPFNSAYAAYGMTYSEFIHSNQSVGYLALVFMHCYERPGIRGESKRIAAAERWYTFLP